MKIKILLVCAFFLFFCEGCGEYRNERMKIGSFSGICYIQRVIPAKYSKVYGIILYEGKIPIQIDNGMTGHYHKKYALNPGVHVSISDIPVYKDTYGVYSAGEYSFSEYIIPADHQ
jgi:hypothetical protein